MFVCVYLIFLSLVASPLQYDVMAQPSTKAAAKPTVMPAQQMATNAAENELNLLKSFQAELRAYEESLEKQAERHFVIFERTVDRVSWAYGGLLAVFLATLAWTFGSTRKEVKSTLGEWMKTDAQKRIDDAGQELRERLDAIRSEVASLVDYKTRRVTWVCPPSTWKISEGAERNSKAEANQEVLGALHATGLQNIQVVTPDTGSQSFDLGDPDLVIMSFDGTSEGRQMLAVIIAELKRRSPPVFLILDTFIPGEAPRLLQADDFRVLEGFLWYVPANFPSQLVAQAQLLIQRETAGLSGANRG